MKHPIRHIAGVLAAALVATALVPPVLRAADEGGGRPTFKHVIVIVLENQSYGDIVGNKDAPFINGVLERSHASATRFFAPFHNSPADYFAMSSGRGYARGDGGDWGGTCDPGPDCSTDDVSVFQQMNEHGMRWRIYSEDQGANCQTRNASKYWVGHNPAVFYRNLGPNDYTTTGNGSCLKDDVPFSELPRDLAAGTVPELVFVIPNNCNNMHDSCKPLSHPIRQGDTWLKDHLAGSASVPGGLISWAQLNDALIVITFDEGSFSDPAYCCEYRPDGGGGHIPTWVIGPAGKVKAEGYKSEVDYSLYSVLRLIEENWSLPLLGHVGDSVTAGMTDFFPSRLRFTHGADVAGATARASGVDYAPNEEVALRWDCADPTCNGDRLATVTAGSDGSFDVRVTIPADAEPGVHALGGLGLSSKRFGSSSFTVRPGLALEPGSASHGSTISARGAGFRPLETVELTLECRLGSCPVVELGTTRADPFGAFDPTDFTIPDEVANGEYRARASGQASGISNETRLWIVEGVTLSPERGPSGGKVTISGRGFAPDKEVRIAWDCRNAGCDAATTMGSVTANAAGDFEATVNIPADAAEANYPIGGIGSGTDFARAWFKVKAPLALWPAEGSPGRKIALSGAGFGPNERVAIRWDCMDAGCTGPVVAVGEATELGELSAVEVVVPDALPSGTYTVGGRGETSGAFATANFTVMPRAVLRPAKGSAGWNIKINAAGFHPSAPVRLAWDCPDGADCGEGVTTAAVTDASGRLVDLRIQVPADGTVGPRILTVTAAGMEPIELLYQVLDPAVAGSARPTVPGGPSSSVGSLGGFLAPALLVGIGMLLLLFLPGFRNRRR